MSRLRAGRYRHYLGAWDPADRLRTAARGEGDEWRPIGQAEIAALGALEPITDGAAVAESEDAIVAALTVPPKVRKELWELGWDEKAASMTPSDNAAFESYGRRVVAFFRAAGVPLGGAAHPCETRLVAGVCGVNPPSEGTGAVALVNVGESDLFVAVTGDLGETHSAISLRVPPDEGCLLSGPARPYVVIVPSDAEFGLLLELA